MYNFTKCTQIIGDDTVQLINDVYSLESRADLVFEAENTSALMHSRYLDLNMTIKNYGLKDASESTVKVMVDDEEIKEIAVGEITIGNGKVITIQNIWVSERSPEKIDLVIDAGFEELSKENNIISFNVG